MANPISVAQSGLNAAQAGLNTTGQNIANANTVGYSRQTVIQSNAGGAANGFGGTQISDIKRAYDNFLGLQRLSAQSTQSYSQIQLDQIDGLDKQFGDTSVGLSPMLQNMFNSLQDLSLAPDDLSRRTAFFDSAQSLVSEFKSLDLQFQSIEAGLDSQLQKGLQSMDGLANQIVAVNKAITASVGPNDGQTNALLDQRDQLVLELSKLVKVNFVSNDGNYDIYMGSGQPLLVTNKVFSYNLVPNASNPDQYDVTMSFDNNTKTIGGENLSGGQIGGLIDFRKNVMDPLETKLDQLAETLATQFNTLNTAGRTKSGASGADLFQWDSLHAAASLSLISTNPDDLAAAAAGIGAPSAGDNSNLLNMINLQTTKLMDGGTTTFQQAFTQMVTMVGTKSREFQLTNSSADNVLKQTNERLNNVSGVNLDEEAANLIRYQQAYQAAGKLIQIYNEMFASLLQIQ